MTFIRMKSGASLTLALDAGLRRYFNGASLTRASDSDHQPD